MRTRDVSTHRMLQGQGFLDYGGVGGRGKVNYTDVRETQGWCITVGGWCITDGGWCITDGGWCLADGGWCITDGGWWVTRNRGWGVLREKKALQKDPPWATVLVKR